MSKKQVIFRTTNEIYGYYQDLFSQYSKTTTGRVSESRCLFDLFATQLDLLNKIGIPAYKELDGADWRGMHTSERKTNVLSFTTDTDFTDDLDKTVKEMRLYSRTLLLINMLRIAHAKAFS